MARTQGRTVPDPAHHRRSGGPGRQGDGAAPVRAARGRQALPASSSSPPRRRSRTRSSSPTARSSPASAPPRSPVVNPPTASGRARPGARGAARPGDRHLHERRQPAQAQPALPRHPARRRPRPGPRPRRRHRRHLGRRLDHEPVHDLDGRGGRHPAPALRPAHRRARPDRRRHHRPALRAAVPLRPAHVDGRGLPQPASGSASTRTPPSRSATSASSPCTAAVSPSSSTAAAPISDAPDARRGRPAHGLRRSRALAARRRYVRPLRGSPRRLRREAPRCRGGPRHGQGLTPTASALPDPQGDPMADRPTPTGPAAPELTIVESRVYRGGEHLVLQPGDPPRRRPRRARGATPRDTIDGLHRPARRAAARASRHHTCSRGVKGGFIERMREGTWLGPRRRARGAAAPAGGRPRPAPRQDPRRQGPARAATTSSTTTLDEAVGLAAGTLAVRLVNHLVQAEEGFDFAEELDEFLRRAQRTAFGPSTAAILEEARPRDIPYIRLNSASLVQLGQGVHAAADPRDDDVQDRCPGRRHRRRQGHDHPPAGVGRAARCREQETVRTADGAVAAARRIGYPVVVKPLDGNHGRGVCLDLQTRGRGARRLRHRRG